LPVRQPLFVAVKEKRGGDDTGEASRDAQVLLDAALEAKDRFDGRSGLVDHHERSDTSLEATLILTPLNRRGELRGEELQRVLLVATEGAIAPGRFQDQNTYRLIGRRHEWQGNGRAQTLG